MATTRKRIATFCRALAARLDPPPAPTISTGWITGPFGMVPVDYSTGVVGNPKITYGTHCGGDTVGP